MINILKFGGSSLADASRIRKAVDIVKKRTDEAFVAVVVSAIGGITNELINVMDKACTQRNEWRPRFENIKDRHIELAKELVTNSDPSELVEGLQFLLTELENEIQKVESKKSVPANQRDYVLSFGERLSCKIFTWALRNEDVPAEAFESQHFIRTNDRFGEADVDAAVTSSLIQEFINPQYKFVPVITGFIGATAENEITTLGRSGSDYTAGIVGEALKAQRIEIWTDVDGVLTADPKVAPYAKSIPRMNYSEIAEMAQFGAKVVHPRTVIPLEELNIPISIKNSFNPDAEGTLITRDDHEESSTRLSVSMKKDIGLITLRSRSLDRIPGLLGRAVYALYKNRVGVTFTASASAEFSASLAVEKENTLVAKQLLADEFKEEHEKGLMDKPVLHFDVSVVSVIGFPLAYDRRVSGSVLTVLGENNIIPMAVARGLANRNLSLIIPNEQAFQAVRLINDHFCTHPKRLRLFIAGIGTIGGELLKQISELKNSDIDYQVVGACNSQNVVWDANGIDPLAVKNMMNTGVITDWQQIVDTLVENFSYRTVFIDCTGSGEAALLYKRLLTNGIHIATPSKIANTIEQTYFDELHTMRREQRGQYLYETTCGAGLPIIQTIEDMMASGDEIKKVTGVVSGTMTFIFGELEQGKSFGEAVKKARELGYAEPDPRDDLSGEDVARKFITLARVAGHKIERRELEVESLIPESLRSVTTAEFLKRIGEFDEFWAKKVADAATENKVLRYVGTMEDGKVQISVQAVSEKTPLGTLAGTDNQVAIYSRRYSKFPMIIHGPGAGAEVTAAGLLADVQKIGQRIVR